MTSTGLSKRSLLLSLIWVCALASATAWAAALDKAVVARTAAVEGVKLR